MILATRGRVIRSREVKSNGRHCRSLNTRDIHSGLALLARCGYGVMLGPVFVKHHSQYLTDDQLTKLNLSRAHYEETYGKPLIKDLVSFINRQDGAWQRRLAATLEPWSGNQHGGGVVV